MDRRRDAHTTGGQGGFHNHSSRQGLGGCGTHHKNYGETGSGQETIAIASRGTVILRKRRPVDAPVPGRHLGGVGD